MRAQECAHKREPTDQLTHPLAKSFWLGFLIYIGEFPLLRCAAESRKTQSANYDMWPLEGSTKHAVREAVKIMRFALTASSNRKWRFKEEVEGSFVVGAVVVAEDMCGNMMQHVH